MWYFDESDKNIKIKKLCTFIRFINKNVGHLDCKM